MAKSIKSDKSEEPTEYQIRLKYAITRTTQERMDARLKDLTLELIGLCTCIFAKRHKDGLNLTELNTAEFHPLARAMMERVRGFDGEKSSWDFNDIKYTAIKRGIEITTRTGVELKCDMIFVFAKGAKWETDHERVIRMNSGQNVVVLHECKINNGIRAFMCTHRDNVPYMANVDVQTAG